ncbi:MAG: tRNA guanosine(15) transglycosylase TgtA [Candidatus Bathyarchaeia archaeon]|jgi:7-cyano-7-deazaguanine tRNA-ribosyltransferase
MSFEIREKDLLARIGRLQTKSGVLETPLLFPVINPIVQPVSPRRIREEFGFEALITNAYILKKHSEKQPTKNGLQSFLDFNGPIMTDSGAYQILVYGDVEVTPKEIVEYQEQIGSDIATILDIPTGWKVTEACARQTVEETLKRAKEFFTFKSREDILWVGPVQGGKYLDLVARSAKEMGKLAFQIHALGSPTEVMERYRFDVLVDMIMTAKINLPVERPLHLFGAGHPFMFALAVASGCDFFDSAAYSLYAKEGRYMTEAGTCRLNELDYFPCVCPKCVRATPKQIMELAPKEVQMFLAEHNLHACAAELKRIKQAIKDGRLWEHLEMRAHGHPALFQALKSLKKYENYVERHDPSVKNSGLFFFSSIGLARPEIVRHRKKLAERYTPPSEAKILLLLPQTRRKPFHKSETFTNTIRQLQTLKKPSVFHACVYSAPFGVVPTELDEMYPLSQHETIQTPDKETSEYVAAQLAEYISRTRYETVVLLDDTENWGKTVLNACRRACAHKKIGFKRIVAAKKQEKNLITALKDPL